MSEIKLVNENGVLKAKDTKTGETKPIKLDHTVHGQLSTERTNTDLYADRFNSLQSAWNQIGETNNHAARRLVLPPDNYKNLTIDSNGANVQGVNWGSRIVATDNHALEIGEVNRCILANLHLAADSDNHDALHINPGIPTHDQWVDRVRVNDGRYGIYDESYRSHIRAYVSGGRQAGLHISDTDQGGYQSIYHITGRPHSDMPNTYIETSESASRNIINATLDRNAQSFENPNKGLGSVVSLDPTATTALLP